MKRRSRVNKWWNSLLAVGVLSLLTACAADKKVEPKPAPETLTTKSRTVGVTAEFREDAPQRYIVKSGDTLWGIAGKFLKNPWHWKSIWHANPQIKNPNLIYPGDVVSFTTVGGVKKLQVSGSSNPFRESIYSGKKTADGRPIYTLKPGVQAEELEQPVPAIPRSAVYPFASKNRVMEPGFANDYPYVVGDSGNGFLSQSAQSLVYVKGDEFDDKEYAVFRETNPIRDPFSNEVLGVEAIYVGDVMMAAEANDDGIASFRLTNSVEPLYKNDVLMPALEAEAGGDLYFTPSLPNEDLEAFVIKPMGNNLAGSQFQTLMLNVGEGEDVVEGNVFKIKRASGTGKGRGGETIQLPDFELAIAVVYKVYDNVSYALVMNSFDVIYPGDKAVRPE